MASRHHVAHSTLTEDALDPEFPGYDVSGADSAHGAKCARRAQANQETPPVSGLAGPPRKLSGPPSAGRKQP